MAICGHFEKVQWFSGLFEKRDSSVNFVGFLKWPFFWEFTLFLKNLYFFPFQSFPLICLFIVFHLFTGSFFVSFPPFSYGIIVINIEFCISPFQIDKWNVFWLLLLRHLWRIGGGMPYNILLIRNVFTPFISFSSLN